MRIPLVVSIVTDATRGVREEGAGVVEGALIIVVVVHGRRRGELRRGLRSEK